MVTLFLLMQQCSQMAKGMSPTQSPILVEWKMSVRSGNMECQSEMWCHNEERRYKSEERLERPKDDRVTATRFYLSLMICNDGNLSFELVACVTMACGVDGVYRSLSHCFHYENKEK